MPVSYEAHHQSYPCPLGSCPGTHEPKSTTAPSWKKSSEEGARSWLRSLKKLSMKLSETTASVGCLPASRFTTSQGFNSNGTQCAPMLLRKARTASAEACWGPDT